MTKAAKKATKKKAPKRKSGLPNLDNATPPVLVDWLGNVREQMKELKQLEGYYKEALRARVSDDDLVDGITGDEFEALISEVTQMRIDTEAVKEEMGEEWWIDHCKETSYDMIKTKRIAS